MGSAQFGAHSNAGDRSALCSLRVGRTTIKTSFTTILSTVEALFTLYIATGAYNEEKASSHAVLFTLVNDIRAIPDAGEREAEVRAVLGSGGRPSKKNNAYTEGEVAAEFRAQVASMLEAQAEGLEMTVEELQFLSDDACNIVNNALSMARRVARHVGTLPAGDSLATVYKAIIKAEKDAAKPATPKPAETKPTTALPPVAELKALIIRACRNDDAHALACFDALAEAMEIMAKSPVGGVIRRAGKTAFAS